MNATNAPWGDPPEGFHFEVVEQGPDWITPPIGAGRCRYGAGPGKPACGRPAAATLMRGFGHQARPWDYCSDHLYGRWIEDGKVVGWRLLKDDEADGPPGASA